MESFKIGEQIVFIYSHGEKQYGFVTGQNDKYIFCRFWSKDNLGSLRTLSSSEACLLENLQKTGENVPQQIIDAWLNYLDYERKDICSFPNCNKQKIASIPGPESPTQFFCEEHAKEMLRKKEVS